MSETSGSLFSHLNWSGYLLLSLFFFLLFDMYILSVCRYENVVRGYLSYKSNCSFCHLFCTDNRRIKKNWTKSNDEKKIEKKNGNNIKVLKIDCVLAKKWRRTVTSKNWVVYMVCPLKRYFNNAKWKISNITIVCETLDTQNVLVSYTRPNPIHFNGMKLGCFLLLFFFFLIVFHSLSFIRIRRPCGRNAYNEPKTWTKFNRTKKQ